MLRLRSKAMRAGVWFRALPRIDRVLVDLTLKVAGDIRSPILVQSLLSIAKKLDKFLESKIVRHVREIGFLLANKLSTHAQEWGNQSAVDWATDPSFARYLAVINLNKGFASEQRS